MTFHTLESFTKAKTGDESLNEDVFIDTPEWLVVCDGATDKSGLRFHDGAPGGRITARLTAETIAQQESGTRLPVLLDAVNTAYAATFYTYLKTLETVDRPSCTFVALDKRAGVVHRVGDVSWSDGEHTYLGHMSIDAVHAEFKVKIHRSNRLHLHRKRMES